jgi:hypothetical protein
MERVLDGCPNMSEGRERSIGHDCYGGSGGICSDGTIMVSGSPAVAFTPTEFSKAIILYVGPMLATGPSCSGLGTVAEDTANQARGRESNQPTSLWLGP